MFNSNPIIFFQFFLVALEIEAFTSSSLLKDARNKVVIGPCDVKPIPLNMALTEEQGERNIFKQQVVTYLCHNIKRSSYVAYLIYLSIKYYFYCIKSSNRYWSSC